MNRPGFGGGDALLLLTVVIWGLTFPISKHILGHWPPMVFAAVRYVGAALFLMALLKIRQGSVAIPRADLLPLAGIGVLGITLFQSLWSNGLALTTASKAAILVSTSPIWAALWATLAGNRPPALALVGVLLSFAGTFLVINNSFTEFNLSGGSLAGDLMFLGNAAIWAVYSAVAPPYLQRLGPLKVTAWAMLIGSVLLLPLAAFDVGAVDWGATPASVWSGLAFTIVLSAALGFVWWYEGLRRLGLTRAMVYSYLIPVCAVAGAVAFLGESFTWVQGAGAAVVLAGIRLARGA